MHPKGCFFCGRNSNCHQNDDGVKRNDEGAVPYGGIGFALAIHWRLQSPVIVGVFHEAPASFLKLRTKKDGELNPHLKFVS